MSLSRKSRQNPLVQRSGFTLVELLVSMTVLALMIAMIGQLMNNATIATSLSSKQAEGDNIARTVFNIMESDFGGMAIRPDVDYFFYKNVTAPGNDSMWFYSNAPSYYTGGTGSAAANDRSPMTFVGYRIPTVNNRPQDGGTTANPNGTYPSYALERVGMPMQHASDYAVHFLTWPAPTTTTPNPAPYANSTIRDGARTRWNTTAPLGAPPHTDGGRRTSAAPTHVVSTQVFRMEFCFVNKDGTYTIPKTPDANATSTVSLEAAAAMRGIGTGNVRGVIVAIAVLDEKSRVIVTPDLSKAAGALPDILDADLTASPPKLMAEKWTTELAKPDFAKTAGIPVAAASQIRVYQRTFNFSK